MRKNSLNMLMLASFILVGCTSDHFIGELSTIETPVLEEPVAIDFGSNARAVTRASHEESAQLLGNQFFVYGTKTSGENISALFDNYEVNYIENSANKTESNLRDWEYVGYTSRKGATQSIKYWDYSANRYDFVAAAGIAATEIITSTNDGMRLYVDNAEALTDIYVADRITATPKAQAATNTTPATMAYENIIQFQFRRLGARMRVGFYETVHGYAVKDLVFYYIGAPSGSYEVGVGGAFPQQGTFTIGYDDATNAAVSTFVGAANKMVFTNNFGLLDYTSAFSEEGIAGSPYIDADGKSTDSEVNVFLGTTAPDATFGKGNYTIDGTPGVLSDFKPILPNEHNTLKMQLRLDYTLVALDGSGEEIHVRDAYVSVPIQYLQWKPNHSYTYLFKISDESNGYTGEGGGGDITVGPGRDPNPVDGGDNDPEIDPNTNEVIPPYIPDPEWPLIDDPDNPGEKIPDPDAPLIPNPDYPEGPGGDQHDPSNPVPQPTIDDPDNPGETIPDPENPAGLFPITFDAVVIDAEDGSTTVYTIIDGTENSSYTEH